MGGNNVSRERVCLVCGSQKFQPDGLSGIRSLGEICKKCFEGVVCSNCGLNLGKIARRYGLEPFAGEDEGEEEKRKKDIEIDVFEKNLFLSQKGNHLVHALYDFPVDVNHKESVTQELDEMHEISRVSFENVFSICTLRKIDPSVSDPNGVFTGNNPKFVSGVTLDHSLVDFSQLSMHRIICKFCTEKINESFGKEHFRNSHKRDLPTKISTDNRTSDSIVSTIGYDALGVIFSFLEFPSSLYLDRVCKNWYYFFHEQTDYLWMTNFVFPDPRGKKRFREEFMMSPILLKEGGFEIMRSIDHRFFGVYCNVDPSICNFAGMDVDYVMDMKSSKNYDDISALKYIYQFYVRTPPKFQHFSNLKKITFENRCCRNITDSGARFIIKMLTGEKKTLEMIGLDESATLTFPTIRYLTNTCVDLKNCHTVHVTIDSIDFLMSCVDLLSVRNVSIYDIHDRVSSQRPTNNLNPTYQRKVVEMIGKLPNLESLYVNKQSLSLQNILKLEYWESEECVDLRLDKLKSLEYSIDEFSLENTASIDDEHMGHLNHIFISPNLFQFLPSLEELIVLDTTLPDRFFRTVSNCLSSTLRIFRYNFITVRSVVGDLFNEEDEDEETIRRNWIGSMTRLLGECKVLEEFTFNCKIYYPETEDRKKSDEEKEMFNFFRFGLGVFDAKNESLKVLGISGIRFESDWLTPKKEEEEEEEGEISESEVEERKKFWTEMLGKIMEGLPKLNRLMINYSSIDDIFMEILAKDEKFRRLRERIECVSLVGNRFKKDSGTYCDYFPNLKLWYQ